VCPRLREEAIKRGWDICNIYNAEALRRVIRVANASGESILPFRELGNHVCSLVHSPTYLDLQLNARL